MASLVSQESDDEYCPICYQKSCLAEQCKGSLVSTSCCRQTICCECVAKDAMRCKCSSECEQVIAICPFCRQVCPISAICIFLASRKCKNRLCRA